MAGLGSPGSAVPGAGIWALGIFFFQNVWSVIDPKPSPE